MYEIKPLACDPARLNGLSEKLHRQPPREQLRRRRQAPQPDRRSISGASISPKTPGFVINGLKREELIAMNSMILHEIYFAGLAASASRPRRSPRLSPGFRQRRRAGRRVLRDGQGAGRRLGLGAAQLFAAQRAGSSTSGRRITRRRSATATSSSRSTCTSTRITSTTARRPAAMSMPSCRTSTGQPAARYLARSRQR